MRDKIKSKPKKEETEVVLLKNQLARALADYDNLRKRVEIEKETWIKFSTEKVLIKLFPVIDILESAQEHLQDQGLGIAIAEFKKVLKEEEIEEIDPEVGGQFNPEIHEAVEAVPGGEKGKIAGVILKGWKFADNKVIRVAKVKVYGERLEKEGK